VSVMGKGENFESGDRVSALKGLSCHNRGVRMIRFKTVYGGGSYKIPQRTIGELSEDNH